MEPFGGNRADVRFGPAHSNASRTTRSFGIFPISRPSSSPTRSNETNANLQAGSASERSRRADDALWARWSDAKTPWRTGGAKSGLTWCQQLMSPGAHQNQAISLPNAPSPARSETNAENPRARDHDSNRHVPERSEAAPFSKSTIASPTAHAGRAVGVRRDSILPLPLCETLRHGDFASKKTKCVVRPKPTPTRSRPRRSLALFEVAILGSASTHVVAAFHLTANCWRASELNQPERRTSFCSVERN